MALFCVSDPREMSIPPGCLLKSFCPHPASFGGATRQTQALFVNISSLALPSLLRSACPSKEIRQLMVRDLSSKFVCHARELEPLR